MDLTARGGNKGNCVTHIKIVTQMASILKFIMAATKEIGKIGKKFLCSLVPREYLPSVQKIQLYKLTSWTTVHLAFYLISQLKVVLPCSRGTMSDIESLIERCW